LTRAKLARLQAGLVDHLRTIGVLTQPAVAAAFRAVPRHLFLPEVPAEESYRDEAIPTKMVAGRAVSSSSQPAIMAIMLEQLELAAGQRVLEIGAGTGYNAALIGQIVGSGGQVTTVDIDDDIVSAAREHLAAAGADNVQVVCADGGQGYAPGAPYDRLILTVAAWDIAPAWYDQLAPGGRLVLPVQLAGGPQESMAFDRTPPLVEPKFISRSARDCGFMPLRGDFAGPEVVTALGPEPGLELSTSGPPGASAEQIYEWLTAPAVRKTTGLRTTESAAFGSLSQWIGLHVPNIVTLSMEGEPSPADQWPVLFEYRGRAVERFAIGQLTSSGIAFLTQSSASSSLVRAAAGDQPLFAVDVLGYGPSGAQHAGELAGLLAAWDAAGRPATSQLRLRVYSRDAHVDLAPGEVLLQKRWSQLIVDWPAGPVVSA
jgi:protein-L-isoaspartate(D-aspartate) O-methyltransferase